MADKPTTVKTTRVVGLNPETLPWPKDHNNFTAMLRKEGARAVGRIEGSEERLAVFIETCKVLVSYAKEKRLAQYNTIMEKVAAAKDEHNRELQRQRDAAAKEVAKAKAAMATAVAAAKALEE